MSAYGAIVAGFARRQDAQAGLDAFRRFLAAGGAPDKMMHDTILSLCIKCEQYKSARQVWWPQQPQLLVIPCYSMARLCSSLPEYLQRYLMLMVNALGGRASLAYPKLH